MGAIEDFIRNKASKLGESDFRQASEDAGSILSKSGGPLAKFVGKLRLFISMLRDYQAGKYKKAPVWTISVAAFALLYVLVPLDLVPDFIPVAGLVDDALVVAAALSMIGQDLKDYEDWLKEDDGATRNDGEQ